MIAVVVYGLYGSATAKWGLSPKVAESGIFDDFWDTIGFAITGMVFFFSGVSCVNFFVRSAQVMTRPCCCWGAGALGVKGWRGGWGWGVEFSALFATKLVLQAAAAPWQEYAYTLMSSTAYLTPALGFQASVVNCHLGLRCFTPSKVFSC